MIDIWKEIVIASPAFYIAWGGLLIGTVFGFIIYRTNFCTMGSISDILSFGDYSRFRAWLLAGATAIIGVGVLQALGVMNPADAMYMTPNFGWAANVVGGSMFGLGMVLSGGCISRNLVRAGAGDLRSLMVLMITGVFAFMTIGGIIGPLRVSLFAPVTADLTELGLQTQGLGEMVGYLTGLNRETTTWAVLALVSGGILIFCFKDARFRKSTRDMVAGFGIGLCVVAGWFLTGLAQDEFADVPVALISLTYVRPTGDTLDYLMRFTALGPPGFGVVTLLGAMLGGFLGAVSMKRLHLITFADKNDSWRNMVGAALMGVGGVLALGCTVGQAMTGFSTLAMGSIITFFFIVMGGIGGMKIMERLA
jgi:uncharacterized protein